MNNSADFYKNLPSLQRFEDAFVASSYHPVPSDWWIALTDVKGSTKAIESGLYKEVNIAGSLAMLAFSNAFTGMEFPFFFGGDGITCLLPPGSQERAADLLAGTVKHIKEIFGMELRAVMIPVADVYAQGKKLGLMKWKVSDRYTQAVAEGEGLDYAEGLMKSKSCPTLISADRQVQEVPSFAGFTCRWQDFLSVPGETVSLLVRYRDRDSVYITSLYQSVQEILGRVEDYHPLRVETSKYGFKAVNLNREVGILKGPLKGWKAFWARMVVRAQMVGSLLVRAFGLSTKWHTKELRRLIEDNILSSDFRKYDNTLKMVVSITPEQRQRLERLLEEGYSQGRIYYGLHISNRATITCMVHLSTGGEVHFVDGADGGYALAAKGLKSQMSAG